MALKRVATATQETGIVIKRGVPEPEVKQEFITKEQLLGRLAIVTLREFSDQHPGKFGPTEKAVIDVIDIESGVPQEYKDFWAFGALAKQIGAFLKPGESGLGRVETGPSKSGNDWFGFGFSEDDDDLRRADEALSAVPF